MNYEGRILTGTEDLERYQAWVLSHPEGNLWQSLERKKYLEACGKTVRIYAAEEDDRNILASALVVIDRTTGGFSTWEIPRGPLCGELRIENVQLKMNSEKNVVAVLLEKIIDDAKKDRCIALYLSPLTPTFILNSSRRIHAEATRILDLRKTEEELLAGMHQKGRYNIGVAKKHEVCVSPGHEDDINAFYELLKSTGGRDGFKISQKSHYARFLSALEGSFILMAKHEGKPVAGLIGAIWNGTGIYYYGASSYEHRHLMAPYLLQWEAIRHCKSAGCVRYDLLGIEPENENSKNQKPNSKKIGVWNLNFGISAPQGSWAGITEFKSKFGGSVITYPKEQMIVLRPLIKKLLELKRSIFG